MKITVYITQKEYTRLHALPNYIRQSKAIEAAISWCSLDYACEDALQLNLLGIVSHKAISHRLNITLTKECHDRLLLAATKYKVSVSHIFITLMPALLDVLDSIRIK